MTTCLETFEKERFCSLPHRHGEATGKPENRDETQRAFSARLPPILTLCSFKTDVFLRVSLEPENLQPQNRCFVRGFRQFSSHLTKRLACHGICTLSPFDAALTMRFAKNTQHATSKVLRLPRKMTMGTSKVLRLQRKLQRIFWKRRKSIAPATHTTTFDTLRNTLMSRSATPATRNAATRRWKHPKVTPFAELTIGTAMRPPRERLRTVANGCGRLRTVADVNATSSARPPEWNGNPCYAFGKNGSQFQCLSSFYQSIKYQCQCRQ